MGNRKRTGQDGTTTTERSANNVSVISPEPPATPPGQHGNGSGSSSPRCNGADLDAYIRHLADAAPPLTDAQRDTLALLLRRPRRS
jgi:hypothetical protein